MVEVSRITDIAHIRKPACALRCFMVAEAPGGEMSLDLKVATFIDRAFQYYVSQPDRCPCCLQHIDQSFAIWHERAASLGLPLGLVYMSLCDGAYFKTLDVRFRRRNGWARKTISATLALWPMMPNLKGPLCQQLAATGLQGAQSAAPASCVTGLQKLPLSRPGRPL